MFDAIRRTYGVMTFRRLLETILPTSVKIKSDPEVYSIHEFVKSVSEDVSRDSILLDAGSGSCQYRNFFTHTFYVSTDIRGENVSVLSDLHFLPFKNSSINIVLNTQVLEHVYNPDKVISEFSRMLKTGGRLYLTASQGWSLHEEPYDYYRYTSYGLEYLFRKNGLAVDYIKPRGGYFWFIGRWMHMFPEIVFSTSFYKPTKNPLKKMIKYSLGTTLLFFFRYMMPYVCFHLDFLDKDKKATLGYKCSCVKINNEKK